MPCPWMLPRLPLRLHRPPALRSLQTRRSLPGPAKLNLLNLLKSMKGVNSAPGPCLAFELGVSRLRLRPHSPSKPASVHPPSQTDRPVRPGLLDPPRTAKMRVRDRKRDRERQREREQKNHQMPSACSARSSRCPRQTAEPPAPSLYLQQPNYDHRPGFHRSQRHSCPMRTRFRLLRTRTRVPAQKQRQPVPFPIQIPVFSFFSFFAFLAFFPRLPFLPDQENKKTMPAMKKTEPSRLIFRKVRQQRLKQSLMLPAQRFPKPAQHLRRRTLTSSGLERFVCFVFVCFERLYRYRLEPFEQLGPFQHLPSVRVGPRCQPRIESPLQTR